LPTSAIDGYTYARNELFYIWDASSTGPSTNTGDRMSLFQAGISSGGVVTVNDYRLQDGASLSSLAHEGQLRVIVYGKRAFILLTRQLFLSISQQTLLMTSINRPSLALSLPSH
jgi:hypothetical protein